MISITFWPHHRLYGMALNDTRQSRRMSMDWTDTECRIQGQGSGETDSGIRPMRQRAAKAGGDKFGGKEALELLRASLPSSIEIRQNIESGVASADASQVHQVLLNCAPMRLMQWTRKASWRSP